MLRPDGPLRGLAMVAEAGGDGSFSKPQLSFTTDERDATAVVGLGDDIPGEATLTVAWYRLTGIDGREHLFSHEIPIGPGGHAYSQGVTEAGLAPGLYETVATLGDRQVRTPWVVRVAGEVAGAPAALSGAFALLSTGSQAQSTPDWDLPGPGEAGWSGPPPTGDPSGPGPCKIDEFSPRLVPATELQNYVSWLGACSTMTLTAAVSGPPQTIASIGTGQGDASSLRGQADVCELPGGSDLPGTTVELTATGSEGARRTESFTLEGHDAVAAGVTSIPPPGSRVEPGQALSFLAYGYTLPPALGVDTLGLYVDEDLIKIVGNKSGSSEPEPCDPRRHLAEIVSETPTSGPDQRYRVPEDPPPVIKACARAIGFDGSRAEHCIEFYTGEVWEGVWAEGSGFTYREFCPQTVPIHGTINFTVADDGSLSGRYSFANDPYTCGGPAPSVPNEGEVTGERTADGFRLDIFGEGYPLQLTRQGNEASGRVVEGANNTTHALTVRCVSCE